MSINVVVSSTAAGVSVSGGTAVAITVSGSTAAAITVGGGIGPAGFLINPGTATNAFGTFQLAAGDGVTISTSAAQFTISSYGTTAVSSLAPVQSVAGRTGNVVLQAGDVTAGTFAIARIPTISYTALANAPATFSPSAHTHSTSDVVSFTAAAAAAAPVQSVAGRSGAISLGVADVAGLAAVASSGSYTSLQNVPATFAPSAHTHSTADITGISGVFAAASHTHDAAAIASGVIDLARIPTIGYTALSGVPATFSPQAHTHSTADVVGLTASFSQVGHTHDYAATIHTHSTADITGYTSFPAQAGKAGPLVTDGTSATWATRYSVVDPVLVQGAGMALTRDTSAGSITVAFAGGTSGVVVSSATPQPLGTASAGSSVDASRADHIHLMPSAADVGAAPAGHAHQYVQVLNGLTGTISIAGGAGVTVSTASSSITISAAGSYVLPEATASILGGIKVGSGLAIASGVLSATGGGGGGGSDSRWDLFLPPAPTSLTATGGNAQVALTWTAPTVLTQTPITDYTVQFSSNSGSTWTTFSDGTSTATSATVTGLTNGTAYTFRVAAVSGVGQGAWSSASNSVTPSQSVSVQYLVVGGGGAGGGNTGGGGGAGQLLSGSNVPLIPGQAYTVTVGGGGTGGASNGANGAASSIVGSGAALIASGGGGGGGSYTGTPSDRNGAYGGSGGGAGGSGGDGSGVASGGSGAYAGGNAGSAPSSCTRTGGGGGGSSSDGQNASGYSAGAGGNGTSSSIGGSTVTYAGGGGGGVLQSSRWGCPSHVAGAAGTGGGGGGSDNGNGASATNNSGSGGGGGAFSVHSEYTGGNGGSGIVIIRSAAVAAATTGSPTITTVGGDTVYTFTQSGSITF